MDVRTGNDETQSFGEPARSDVVRMDCADEPAETDLVCGKSEHVLGGFEAYP